MNEFRKCSKCESVLLKSNFRKHKNMKDGLHPHCICCVKDYNKNYYNKNRDRLINKQIIYDKQNRDKINEYQKQYIKNKRESDVKFRLITNTRNRIYQALKGDLKSSSTKEILGIDIDLYRKWLEFQFTPEMNWSNIQVDHVKPICMFDVSKNEELKEAFNWKNTQPLLKEVHAQKGIKFNFLDYQLQFIKAYQFLRLNEGGYNENLH